jgi:Putative cyclase
VVTGVLGTEASLICPAAVMQMEERARTNPDAPVTVDDLQAWEAKHGRIPPGAAVLMYSGWEARIGDQATYRNMDAKSMMHFPGFSPEASEFRLKEREINGIGVDTPRGRIPHPAATAGIAGEAVPIAGHQSVPDEIERIEVLSEDDDAVPVSHHPKSVLERLELAVHGDLAEGGDVRLKIESLLLQRPASERITVPSQQTLPLPVEDETDISLVSESSMIMLGYNQL